MAEERSSKGVGVSTRGVGNKGSATSEREASVSLGIRERKLLIYLNNLSEWFNKKACARKTGIPRTSIYDVLDQLYQKGLVNEPRGQSIKPTALAIIAIDNIARTKPKRLEASRDSLSTHHIWYRCVIKDKSKFRIEDVKRLNPLSCEPNPLPNRIQHIVKFDGVTCIIDTRKFSIRIHDIVSESTEEHHYEMFSRATKVVDQFASLGLSVKSLQLSEAHWAIVEPLIAEVLESYGGQFYVELSNGEKLWIDHSPPHKSEIETNSDEVRDRLKEQVGLLADGSADLSDLDMLKRISGDLTQVCSVQLQQHEGHLQVIGSLADKLSSLMRVNENTASGVEAITKYLQVTQLQQLQNQSMEVDHAKPDYLG